MENHMLHYEKICADCDHYKENMDTARHWLDHLLDLMYSKSDMEETEVEHALEEMAFALGRGIPMSELQIVRKKEKKISMDFDPVKDWISFNNQYLKQNAAGTV